MKARFVGAAMNHGMDHPGRTVIGEHHRRLTGKQGLERHMIHAVRPIFGGAQNAQVDDIDQPHANTRHVFLQQPGR
ncbi:hypothetical protein PSYPI_18171, partial [Pseudomonas syringae pv. pisi str. 1704B]